MHQHFIHFRLCQMLISDGNLLWRKEWSDSSWSASNGEFIEQTVTETCTFQHTRKFPMTSVCDISLYLSISFSVYVAQTQSLFGACCLRTLLHLHHYLDRVHSDLNNMLFEQCQDIICGAVSRLCSPTNYLYSMSLRL